jgi:magnesium and cobalt transporter
MTEWLHRISQLLTNEPKNAEELLELLQDASERGLLDPQALEMMEGILHLSELRVRDIMIPRSQMTLLEKTMTLNQILPIVIQTVHSRFPVIGENKDEILGILLAKDLLAPSCDQQLPFDILQFLRPAVFVPESKRADILLQEFRATRNHMAIVVDEYGGITGLITIEDVLEQIVGNIEDEYDDIENEDNIKPVNDDLHTVKGLTTIEEFNDYFNTELEDKEVETIGGLVTRRFGYLPKRGETVTLGNYHFKVLRADTRRIYLLQASKCI